MSAEGSPTENRNCRLCGGQVAFSFSARVLRRHDVSYYLCSGCGLLQSEEPYWLEEAYDVALSAADTGVMQRNMQLLRVSAVLLRMLGLRQKSFLDYGGGYGVFTRMMRDHGFDFHCWDKHAGNLFARGFEGDPDQSYDGVTAFEVIEHLVEPGAFFRRILGKMKPKVLLVGTETFVEPVNSDWDYFYFPTGQHIAFYQPKTLDWLGECYGYRRVSVGGLHVFVQPELYCRSLRLILRYGARLYPLFRFPSRIAADHEQIMCRLAGDDEH